MNDPSPSFSGVLGSLRRLLDNGVGAVRDRMELLSIEIEEEKLRLIRILLWISGAVVCGIMAIAFFSFTLVYLCSARIRPAVLIGLTVAYALAALLIALSVRRQLIRQPRVFSATVEELNRDRSCLEKQNSQD
jgi:uncharacterized membrane protein YqjE